MAREHHLLVGLTGGIGCGKSTAAAFFAELGFVRLDADQVVRDVLLPRPDIVRAVAERFGTGVLTSDGHLDRARLATAIFTNDEARRWLENLLHPQIRTYWEPLFTPTTPTRFIVEVPLLFEAGWENWFDFTICVSTDSFSQIRRLEQRGLSPTQTRQRIAKQLPLERKRELADFVLLNDGSQPFLREQVALLADRLAHPSSPNLPLTHGLAT